MRNDCYATMFLPTALSVLIFCVFCTHASTAAAQQSNRPSVPSKRYAVLKIVDKCQSPKCGSDVDVLTETLQGAIATAGCEVMTRENILLMLPPNRRDLEDCESDCEVETGRNLGADFVISGSVSRIGSFVRLTLRKFDTATARLVNQAEVDSSQFIELDRRAKEAVSSLCGDAPATLQTREARVVAQEAPSLASLGAVLVSFESSPTGAAVFNNGQMLCRATPCSKLIPMGPHQISMAAELHEPHEERLTIDETKRLRWILKPRFGVIDVESLREGLEVRIDNILVGRTPLQNHRLSPGPHRIEVDRNCWLDWMEQIVLKNSEHRTISLGMKAKTREVKIIPQDSLNNDIAAEVQVDGVTMGHAPNYVRIPECSEWVVARFETGFSESKRTSSLGSAWSPVDTSASARQAPHDDWAHSEVRRDTTYATTERFAPPAPPKQAVDDGDASDNRAGRTAMFVLSGLSLLGGVSMSILNQDAGAELKRDPTNDDLRRQVDFTNILGIGFYGASALFAVFGLMDF